MQIISRAEAKLQGLTRYFTGKKCKNGHVDVRKVSNSNCASCDKDTDRRFYVKHRDKVSEKQTLYYKINSDRVKTYQRRYRSDNKCKINARHNHRYGSDECYKLSFTLRRMLRKQVGRMNTNCENYSLSDLCYTPKQLRDHLESLFTDGMSWDNHGEWHIDHIIPVSILLEYGITDPAFINGLDNLQPLWAIDNMIKGNRYVG